jgi:hypothetical protein
MTLWRRNSSVWPQDKFHKGMLSICAAVSISHKLDSDLLMFIVFSSVVFPFVVMDPDLSPNFAARREVRVHVRISLTGANSFEHFIKIAIANLLAGVGSRRSNDVRRGDRTSEVAGTISAGRSSRRTGTRGRLTKPDNNAAIDTSLADMDVGLSYFSLYAAV